MSKSDSPFPVAHYPSPITHQGLPMVYLNGEFMPIEQARIPVLDRGFLFGDGVYEYVPVYSRPAFRLHEHYARLEKSLAAIRIPNPFTEAGFADLAQKLIAAQPFANQGIYL